MKKLSTGIMIVSFFLLCLSFNCAQQGKEMNIEADKAAINEMLMEYSSSLKAGDAEAWISLWADDGVQMPPGSPAIKGKDNIKEKNMPMFNIFNTEMSVVVEDIQVSSDWAFARGNYSYNMVPKEEGETINGEGKYLTIFKRQIDGSWKIAVDCFNNINTPPE